MEYTTRLSSLLVLIILSLSSSFSFAITKRCNPSDYKALMQIKKALNNPYHLASWIPNTDCCGWKALECDPQTHRVIYLSIFSGTVSGQIPATVGDLPYLQTLIFRDLTNITGSIPRSITKLKYLKTLRLDSLNLSGPVPDFLSELTTLTTIDLSFNHFSGSIPASLSKLKNLYYIDISNNKLTGPIPESFGHFTGSTPDLYFSHNQLSGPIPKSLGNLNFKRINFSNNKLVGDASILFKPKGSTLFINLSWNILEFDFSKVAGFPNTLISFHLNHNRVFGSIPKGLIGLPNLVFFNVSHNRLCGEIPKGGAKFDASSYAQNRCLCGAPLIKCH